MKFDVQDSLFSNYDRLLCYFIDGETIKHQQWKIQHLRRPRTGLSFLTAAQALGQASYRAKKPEEADATSNCWGPHKGRITLQQSSGYCLLTLLPESWRAALTAGQQKWIGQVLFTRDSSGRSRLTGELNLWWYPPQARPIYNQSPRPLLCTSAVPVASAFVHRVLDKGCTGPSGGSWTSTAGISWPLSTVDVRRRLSCDLRVVVQLRSRTLGNSANRLYNTLREQHTDAWMQRAIRYLGVCKQFLALGGGRFPPPPPDAPCSITRLTADSLRVTTKLAGTASDTTAWVTNVGNEHRQVLMNVLTYSEGLSPMAVGLMRRYRLAGVPPPQLMYVDRDCCNRDGVSRTAALFQVRKDRILTMLQNVRVGEGKHGMVGPTDAEVIKISQKKWRLHCHRRTLGQGDSAPHPGPSGLYTETGRLTKGGVSLPVYRCARGSTSLESFHINRFIPGTRASGKYFQEFLVDGLASCTTGCG
uniref:DUF6729 domain-containing protein n=1 Tax=Larimichthys crocea TaxID=215358 RepID=A0A0F8CJ42_LARCR